ncbi:MAG: metalloregulator ArsR/SmtB family transcription factor [Firmicutes bacterium]|jgi:ArsR family transcriptional regulator|nr:metalloregulator ArsR/SmtB family transcription factor [Bacillota bacterium]
MLTDKIERRVSVFKALAHETRVRIAEILAEEGEKCVCELVERLGFDQSTISKHLSVLKNAGVVAPRKDGLNVWYRLEAQCVHQLIKCIDNMDQHGSTEVSADCLLVEDSPSMTIKE